MNYIKKKCENFESGVHCYDEDKFLRLLLKSVEAAKKEVLTNI